jgi:hypothetical protein
MTRIDYGGRRFRPADPDAPQAEGHYRQDGDLVWAEFTGTHVRAGRLVGTCRIDGSIDAVYCYVTSDGERIAGSCVSTPTVMADGRISLTERWHRMDGSSGVSQVEEVSPGRADVKAGPSSWPPRP